MARRYANLQRVRAQELQEALEGLVEAVGALPMSVTVQPTQQEAQRLRAGEPVAVFYGALVNPLFQERLAEAKRVLSD